MTFRTVKRAGACSVLLLVGIALGAGGVTVFQKFGTKIYSTDIREAVRSDTILTSPLLECRELSSSLSDETLATLREKSKALMDKAQKAGDIIYASIYFRDLSNGPWFGLNEADEFFPASLLKLPLAMSFYGKAEDDPAILSKEITYRPDPSTAEQVQPFGPVRNVEAGKKYTIQALLDIMLQESSNESAVALAEIAGQEQITSVYRDLGLTPPVFGQDYKIDTHKYASFFRILYNATYIDRSSSEKILQSLTETSFKDGLVAGVPQGITLAHKFGSRQVDIKPNTVQLHDCGIIYVPNKPYILCVMTQGSDFTQLADFIKQESALVYKYVSAQ